MDFRARAELVMLSLFGLSAFTLALGFSIRAFLAPTLRDLFGRPTAPSHDQQLLNARLQQLEDRLDSIETSLDRIADGRDFDRQLERPKTG
jgi:hypothetical protein